MQRPQSGKRHCRRKVGLAAFKRTTRIVERRASRGG
jgi:hypothetical protein